MRYWLLSTSILYFIMIYTPIASQILHFVNYKIPFVQKSLADLTVTGNITGVPVFIFRTSHGLEDSSRSSVEI
jgi:hypothetical protein